MRPMKYFLPLLLFILLFTKGVSAQEMQNTEKQTALGVSPAIIEVITDVKSSTEKVISLYNLTNFPLPIKTLKESFTPKEKLEIPPEKQAIYDASSWMHLEDNDMDFILQPHEVRQIKVIIKEPKKASPGGHYATLIFQPLVPEAVISKQSVFVFARVAVLFFMQVKGDISENVEIKNLNVNSFYRSTPLELSVILKNKGNTHLRPAGTFEITDEKKKIIARIPITPSLLLPGTEKEYTITLDTSLPLGKYSAQAVITYGVDNKLLTSPKRTFYFFPNNTIIYGVILFPLLILSLLLRKRLIMGFHILMKGEKALKKWHTEER